MASTEDSILIFLVKLEFCTRAGIWLGTRKDLSDVSKVFLTL